MKILSRLLHDCHVALLRAFYVDVINLVKILVYFASEPKMSAGISALALTEEDVTKMLAATTHIGSDNSETTMEQYVWKKKTDGLSNLFLSLNLWPCWNLAVWYVTIVQQVNIINLKKTWEKLLLAARAVAVVVNLILIIS